MFCAILLKIMTANPFLAVSYSIPSRASGTPVATRKFLENFRKDELVLIGRPVQKREQLKNINFSYPTLTVPTPPVGFRGEKIWHFFFVILGIFTGLYAIKRYKLKAILAFYRDESSLLLGYFLHLITGIPFYAYFFDVYLENYSGGLYGSLARWLQPRVFQKAVKIFVLTEAMKEYFWERYQQKTTVLPHSNNRLPHRKKSIELKKPFTIGYLGSINVDRTFSLKTLCDAIKENDQFQLTYFGPVSVEHLASEGLLIKNSKIKFIPSNELLMHELSQCDLLFLPIMLSSQNATKREQQVLTGFPTKAIEYLLCQKPILVHSANHYWTARFFQKYGCGLVVSGGKEDILHAIQNIKDNPILTRRLITNTKKALFYFDGDKIAERFKKELF